MQIDASFGADSVDVLGTYLREVSASRPWEDVALEAALLGLKARGAPGTAPLDPPPEVSAKDALLLRVALERAGVPAFFTEEALALFRYAHILPHVEGPGYTLEGCVALASRLPSPMLIAALDAVGRKEDSEMLELALSEFELETQVMGTLLGPEELDPELPEADRAANALRWERVHGHVKDKWSAWSRLPGLVGEHSACLRIKVAPPGAPEPPLDRFEGTLGKVLRMEDVSEAKGAQARRRAAVLAIAESLRGGRSINWFANSTTQESRRAPIQAAREAGARVEFFFYGGGVEALHSDLAKASWPVAERVFMRGARVLEGPRPHEGERVYVYGGYGDDVTMLERWDVTVGGELERQPLS